MRREGALSIVSSKPAVVSRPARTPCFSTRALVTAVVPSPKRSTLARKTPSSRPICSATSRHAPSTPRPNSWGSVGDLARHNDSPSPQARSVKVPPTSIPTENPLGAASGDPLAPITYSLSSSCTVVRECVVVCPAGCVHQDRMHGRARPERLPAPAEDAARQPDAFLHVHHTCHVGRHASPGLGEAQPTGRQRAHGLVRPNRHVHRAGRVD